MNCRHSLAERETACVDGMCPLCLSSEGATREKAAFLAGWDFYNASRSRMDLPRDRIGAYNHWKATVSEEPAPCEHEWSIKSGLSTSLDGKYCKLCGDYGGPAVSEEQTEIPHDRGSNQYANPDSEGHEKPREWCWCRVVDQPGFCGLPWGHDGPCETK